MVYTPVWDASDILKIAESPDEPAFVKAAGEGKS